MMNLNYTVIQQIINDLEKSINWHTKFQNLKACIKEADVNCEHCQLQEVIDDLDCLKSHLKPHSKNTSFQIQFIDAESFATTLSNQFKGHGILIVWTRYNESANELFICVQTERYCMDSEGGHEGYEFNTFEWKVYSRTELGLHGYPGLLSNYVVNPDEYELVDKNYPAEWTADHDPDCELNLNPNGECDCGAIEHGYWHPDEDFVYQEMQHILDQCNWIEAEFDSDTRTWKLGELEYDLTAFEFNSEYADDMKIKNGMPSGRY